jgi:WD40 repeat protein
VTKPSNFYVAGGTLCDDAESYVYRKADEELYQEIVRGELCYILTSRQMGKSSLMVRTSARLRNAKIAVAVLDLTAIGQNLSPEQWYGGLLMQLGSRFALQDELMEFWQRQLLLGPLQRWVRAIRDVVLKQRSPERIVIFIDEIDAVRSLPFSADEFFAGIRECYNYRTQYREMERLTFCLLGVAAPTDLVRDVRMTPFNIGRRIELHDFTAEEAEPLACGLGRNPRSGAVLLKRVLHWTGGHPYLTQRMCLEIVQNKDLGQASDVDRFCADLFFTDRAQERDDNLLFVRERMLRCEPDPANLLDVYRRIRKGKAVNDDETNPVISTLRLSGVTRAEKGRLKVRNRIYSQVFDQKWIDSVMPHAELLRQRAAYRRGIWRTALIGSLILLIVSSFALVAIKQSKRSQEQAEINRRLLYDADMRLAQEAWDQADTARVTELLQTTERNQSDLRGIEWYLLDQLTNPGVWHLTEDHPVVAADLSADGKLLWIGESETNEYLLKLYDLAAGKELNSFQVPTDAVFPVVIFSPDRQNAVVGGREHTAMLFDLTTGRQTAVFAGHKDRLTALALSGDGKRLGTGDLGGVVKLWNLHTGKPPLTLKKQPRWPRSIALSPNGSVLAVADESPRISLWNARTGQELAPMFSMGDVVTAAFFPDGERLLTATKNGDLQAWDLKTRRIIAVMSGHSGHAEAVAFSPDGKTLATGNWDRTVKLWSTATLGELETIKGHGAAVFSVSWSSDGKSLVTCSQDNTVKVWNVANEQDRPWPPEKVNKYVATTFSTAKELLALGVNENDQVKLWNLSQHTEVAKLDELGDNLMCASFSRSKNLVATGGLDHTVKLWDATTGQEIRSFEGHDKSVYAVSFAPNGELLVSGGYDRTLRLWSVSTGREIAQLIDKDIAENSWAVAFSPSGKYLVFGTLDGHLVLWNVATRQVLRKFTGHTGKIRTIAFSSNGRRLASGSDDHTLRLWDVASGRLLKTLGTTDSVQRAAFSPDDRRLVTGEVEGTIKLWDLLTEQELMTLQGHTDEVKSITFSDDGKSLATSGADGVVRLWRTSTSRGQQSSPSSYMRRPERLPEHARAAELWSSQKHAGEQ